MAKFLDLTGQTFGRLEVLRRVSGKKPTYWLCKCLCGNVVKIRVISLTSGATQSCGCLRREITGAQFTLHGKHGSKENRAWRSMLSRCYNPKVKCYPRYGGRGIKVCDSWRSSFMNFFIDMGPCPSPRHSIDRKDNNGHYEPKNCRWATEEEQRRNTRRRLYILIDGKAHLMADYAKRQGIDMRLVSERLRRGWTVDAALHTPKKRR